MAWISNAILTAAQLNAYLPQSWSLYTPTLTGTGTTQGNGVSAGAYIKYGSLVHFWGSVTVGSTTVIGTRFEMQLPVAALSATEGWVNIWGLFIDTGATSYASAVSPASTTVSMWIPGTNGAFLEPSATSPFTWAAGDKITVGGTYRPA